MGVTLRQKVKGKGKPWWVFINHNGKRKSIKVGSKVAAQELQEKIQAKLQLGDLSINEERPKFKDYIEPWIKALTLDDKKESTIKDYRDILRIHVLPAFGDLDLVDVTRKKIKNFLFQKLDEGKAKSTVKHFKAVISGILNEAVDDEVILANPAHRLKLGKSKSNGEDINPLTREEVKKLLDTVQEHFSKDYPLFLLLARTGVRIGEAVGLRWRDIDFNGRFINIERTFSRGRITSPKNGKSRPVDMSWQLKDALFELKKKRVVVSINEGSDWVFANDKGNPIDANNWRRRIFKPALKKAEIRDIRIHDIRHGYATLRLSKGDNIVDVANQLGDNVEVVLKVYSHWMPGKKKDEVDALDDPKYTHSSTPPPHPMTKKGFSQND